MGSRQEAAKRSVFLQSFLGVQRTCETAPPPFEEEARNDEYLRGFSTEFSSSNARRYEQESMIDAEDEWQEAEVEVILNATVPTVNKLAKRLRDETAGLDDSGIESEEDERDAEPDVTVHKLKLGNLPFKMSIQEMKRKLREKKVEFTDLVLDMDKERGIPAGTAVLTLTSAEEWTACFVKLKDAEWMGRPLRVISLDSSRPSMGGKRDARYYLDAGITKKCVECGQLGHIKRECRNAPLPMPCHLCAGLDHEAMQCPNITCFKCGQFGHHVKDCHGRRATLANGTTVALCSKCGVVGQHCTAQCSSPPIDTPGTLSADAACCMKCGEFGHVLCRPLPGLESMKNHRQLYCPNCGKDEHHVDYTLAAADAIIAGGSGCKKSKTKSKNRSREPVTCMAPRQEAYNRFSQLLHDTSNNCLPKDARELNEYYARLARTLSWGGQNEGAVHLFPSLAASAGTGTGGSGGGSGNGNGSGQRFKTDGPSHRVFSDLDGLDEYYVDNDYYGRGRAGGGGGGAGGGRQRHSTGSFEHGRSYDDGTRRGGGGGYQGHGGGQWGNSEAYGGYNHSQRGRNERQSYGGGGKFSQAQSRQVTYQQPFYHQQQDQRRDWDRDRGRDKDRDRGREDDDRKRKRGRWKE